MNNFINKQQNSAIEDYLDSYIKKKPADCILYSEGGFQFKIHKELFGQTEFMRKILTSANGQCCSGCSMIEILCPCNKEDLGHLVHFLYDGEIHCDSETDSAFKILSTLSQVFGFPEDMHLQCQKKPLDENSSGSSQCEDLEVFEDITNDLAATNFSLKQDEQVKLAQSEIAKNTEDGIVRKNKLSVKKQCAKKRKFMCDDCGFAFNYKSQLEIHVNGVHLKIEPFKCNKCEASFTLKGNLDEHVRSVHKKQKPFNCNHCSFKCSQKGNLYNHVRSVHKKLKPFNCNLCSFKCSQKGNLDQHVRRVHEKLKPFQCSHCEKAFSQKTNLQLHIWNIHEEIMQSCPHCEKSFPPKDLKTHILTVHEKIRFNCTFCKASFSEKKKLRAHVRTVHM